MVGADIAYVTALLEGGYIHGPCLELGAGLEGTNNRELIGAEASSTTARTSYPVRTWTS